MSADRREHQAAAPLGRRLVAFVIDAVIGGLALFALIAAMVAGWIAVLGGPYWGWDSVETALEGVTETTVYALVAVWLVAVVVSFVWFVLYGLLRDSFGSGQSWGKRLLGLRVIDSETGLPCGRQGSVMRNLPGLALALVGAPAGLLLPFCGWIVLLVEPLAVLIGEERLRIGDRWARTRVVSA